MKPASIMARAGFGQTSITLPTSPNSGSMTFARSIPPSTPDSPNRPPIQRQDRRHKGLVDQAGQHGDHDIQAGLIRHSQTADEPRADALPLHPLADRLAAPVHHDGLHAPALQGDQVLQRRVVAAESAAANLYYDRPNGIGVLLRSRARRLVRALAPRGGGASASIMVMYGSHIRQPGRAVGAARPKITCCRRS